MRSIRTRKQLELQFTKRSINSRKQRRNSGTFRSSNGTRQARAASSSLNGTNRIISFDDEEDLESLSESPTTAATRKRNRSDPVRPGGFQHGDNFSQNSDAGSNVNKNGDGQLRRNTEQAVPATAVPMLSDKIW